MTKRIRQSVIIFILANACLAMAVASPAYVLGPDFVLDKMIKAMGWPSGYVVTQQVGLDNSACEDLGDYAAARKETAWFKPPGNFRTETTVNNGRRVYVFAFDRALTLINHEIISTDENPLMVYKDLFVFRGRERLAERLSFLGVDTSVVSLGRFGDTVAFVIGAKYPDESMPQLWVDKETFLPVRLLLKNRPEGPAVEVRYRDWRREYGFQFPWRVEIYQNGRISRVICVRDVRNDFSEPDGFFDIAALRAKYPVIRSDGDTAVEPAGGNGDIQRTIDDFKKLYQ